jgi:quercetin 2,3-dioxygenase
MLIVRKSRDRGPTKIGWLDSKHTFSFGGYRDPAHTGFSHLLVINEDRVIPGAGFETHGHSDMEIISYVIAGALEHKDSIGTGSVIRPGEVQRMSAGTGIRHSEFNASQTEPVHFLQIWIEPERWGLPPSYEQKPLPRLDGGGAQLDLIGSRDGSGGSVTIHQDVSLYRAHLPANTKESVSVGPGRRAWVQVVRGAVRVNDISLSAGDGLAVTEEPMLRLAGEDPEEPAELLIFDLA